MTFKKISYNSIIDPNQLHDYLNEQIKKDHILKEFKQTFSNPDTTQFWDRAKQNPQAYYAPFKRDRYLFKQFSKKQKIRFNPVEEIYFLR